jgi:hypothetical protein
MTRTGLCPDCAAPLGAAPAPACPVCHLPLLGPVAAELWTLDLRLAALDAERGDLLVRRPALVQALRATARVPAARTGPPPAAAPTAAAARRTSGRTVQNVLLSLGGLLLAVAAVVFTVVAWGRFGVGGRAAILAAVTAATLAVPRVLVRRELRATAETIVTLGLGLLLLDGYAGWHVGLFRGLDGSTYAGLVAAVAAAVAAAYPAVAGVRVARPFAVALAQPVPALLALSARPGPTGWALVAALTVAADLAVAVFRTGRRPETVPALLGAGTAWALGTLLGLLGLVTAADAGRAAAAGLAVVLLGLLGTTAGVVLARRVVREVAAAWTVVAVALTACVAASHVDGVPLAVVLAATAVVLAAGTVAVPASWRVGPAAGALAVTVAAAAVPAGWTLVAGLLPLSWLVEPWSAHGGSARTMLSAGGAWPAGAPPVLAACLVAAAAAVLGARRSGRRAAARVAVGAVLPVVLLGGFALDLPWTVLLAAEGLVAALLCASAARRTGRVWSAAYAAGLVLALHATLWAVAGRVPSLVAFGVWVVTGGALAAYGRRDVFAAPAVAGGLLALAAEAGALGASAGHGGRTVALLSGLGAVPALVAVAAFRRRWPVTATAAAWTVPLTVPVAAAVAIVDGAEPEFAAALAGLAVAVAALPAPGRRSRWGLGAVALVGTALAAAASAEHVARALAAAADGPGLTPVTLAVVALAVGLLARVPGWRPAAAALPFGAAALVTVPNALGFGWWPALAWHTALAVAAAVAAARLRDRAAAAAATAVTVLVGATAVLWSLDRAPAALAVAGTALVTGGALAATARSATGRRIATAVAVAALPALTAAIGATLGLAPRWQALGVLAAAAATAGAAAALRTAWPVRSRIAEVGAAAGTVVAVGLTAGHPWHTGLVLALAGAGLAAVALRPDRRPAAVAAILAKLAASWAWLAAADVTVPEAYTLPAALLGIGVGLVALRRRPATSSWSALAPGLVAALLPTLLLALTGLDQPVRRFLLGAAALGVTLAGGATRRQAPFALGAVVLAVAGLRELGPVAADGFAAAPSWVPLSLGGVLLVAVGATYEQRRRDLARLRAAVLRMT